MESFIKLMPEGVGFIPAHAGIRAGNEQELQEALTVAEKKVARLAELGADVVMIRELDEHHGTRTLGLWYGGVVARQFQGAGHA